MVIINQTVDLIAFYSLVLIMNKSFSSENKNK